MKKLLILLVLLPVMVVAKGVLEFPNADIYYSEGYEKIAAYVGNTFEAIRDEAIGLVGNDPGKINIVLLDMGTDTNGMAMAHNHKTIYIYVWPPDAHLSTRLNTSNMYRQLLMHEFTHIVHLTYTSGVPAFISRVVLGTELFSPQQLSPFVEGVTVFAESSNYFCEGRLNNPLWGPEMSYQNYSANSFANLGYALAVLGEDYRGGALYYNYMANFYDYLVRRFGIEAVKKFHFEMSGRMPVIGLINSSKIAFGDTLDNLYEDWEEEVSSKAAGYPNLSEIKSVENGQIFDIVASENGVVFSYARYGEATAWVGTRDVGVEELSEKGFDRRLSDFGAISLKWKAGNTYLMTSVRERGRVLREVWQQKPIGSVNLLKKGEITAFDIFDGQFVSVSYDKQNEASTIFFDEMEILTLPWFVKDIVVMPDGNYAMLLSRRGVNGALALLSEGELQILLEDPYMKGRGIDFKNGKILYTAAYEEGYMDAFEIDIFTREISRLTRGANLEKAVVSRGYLYGFGHSRELKGMSIYRFEYSPSAYSLPEAARDDFHPEEHEYVRGDYLKKSLLHFVNPILRVPLLEYDGKDFSLSYMLLHQSLDADHTLTLIPGFNFTTTKPFFQAQYDGKLIDGINLNLQLNLGKPALPLGRIGLSAELFQMPLNPSTRFRTYAFLGVDTSGDILSEVPFSLSGNLFNLTLTPGLKLESGKVKPSISFDAGFAPTLKTFVGLGGGFEEEFYWYANAAQAIWRIDWGWSPLFFLKEVGLGVQVRGTNLTLESAAFYAFVNLGSTIGFGDLFPKLGVSYTNNTFGIYFGLELKP